MWVLAWVGTAWARREGRGVNKLRARSQEQGCFSKTCQKCYTQNPTEFFIAQKQQATSIHCIVCIIQHKSSSHVELFLIILGPSCLQKLPRRVSLILVLKAEYPNSELCLRVSLRSVLNSELDPKPTPDADNALHIDPSSLGPP